MAWRFRRSRRLPGGFRLNFSKSGFGWSWGLRGFRVGRDSRGRLVRTVSIPGTGLYNRQVLSAGDPQGQNTGLGFGGCIGRIFGFFLVLFILGEVIESGTTTGLILLLISAVAGYVAWQYLRRSDHEPTVESPPHYEALGQEVKAMFEALAVPIKDQLRKSRGATAYEAVFENSFTDLICRFAALDGTISPPEAKVYLDIFTVLHPKTHAGLSPENCVTVLEGHRQRNQESFQLPVQNSLLLRLAQRAGESFANNLKELMCRVALQVALADGPLSSIEQSELEALRNASTTPPENVVRSLADTTTAPEPTMQPKQKGAAVGASGTLNLSAVEVPKMGSPAVTGRSQHQLLDPQFASVSGLVTIDSLKQTTKVLVGSLETPLKVELRKARMSRFAEHVLEQDIRAVIIRFGFTDGSISEYAAHLYLEIFKCLHPRTYGRWTVDSAVDFLHRMMEDDGNAHLGDLKKPNTLGLVESFDAEHGTAFAKATRDLLLTIAAFAASVDGKVLAEKEAEIVRLKSTFGAAG